MPKHLLPSRAQETGNALWFILIGVVLLGVLTMVLSRSGSSVDQTADVEQLRVASGQILRYAQSIEAGIQNMKLRGVSESDISFANSVTATDYTNANCTATDCLVFDVGGAGLVYRNFDSVNGGTDWIFTGANNVGTTAGPIGTTADGTGNDLVMLLPGVSEALCIQINRDLNVGTAGTLPAETTGVATAAFTGDYPTGGPTILDGDPTPFELDNEKAGCFINIPPNPDVIYFYYTVLER